MHIVIGGYGRVGHYLAHMLERDGNTVSVIDHDPFVLEELDEDIHGQKFLGEVFDRDALIKAGIERAGCYAAVTSGDNSNVVSARIAKDRFEVPLVLARIYDPRRAELYRDLGIRTISSVEWTSTQLLAMITRPEIASECRFGGGEVELVELRVPTRHFGKRAADFELPGQARVTAVVHEHRAALPGPGVVLAKGDRLYVAVERDALDRFEKLWGKE